MLETCFILYLFLSVNLMSPRHDLFLFNYSVSVLALKNLLFSLDLSQCYALKVFVVFSFLLARSISYLAVVFKFFPCDGSVNVTSLKHML